MTTPRFVVPRIFLNQPLVVMTFGILSITRFSQANTLPNGENPHSSHRDGMLVEKKPPTEPSSRRDEMDARLKGMGDDFQRLDSRFSNLQGWLR